MKRQWPIPVWKRYLSYLFEVPLYSLTSTWNPLLQVSVVRGRLQLSTTHSIYSFDDYYRHFYEAFFRLPLPNNGANCLVLGLGLGSIPYMLEHQFGKRYHVTAVEIDEAIIELFTVFTLPRLNTKLEIFHTDAEIFVSSSSQTFDIIAVDLFLDDVIPDFFERPEALQRISELLNPGGLILYNRLYRDEIDRKRTDTFFNQCFREVFPDARYLEVEGNRILYANLNT